MRQAQSIPAPARAHCAWTVLLAVLLLPATSALAQTPIALPPTSAPLQLTDRLQWAADISSQSATAPTDEAAWKSFATAIPWPSPLPQTTWFRVAVTVPQSSFEPALLITPRTVGCAIFVDGREVANCRSLGRENYWFPASLLVHLAPSPTPHQVLLRLDHPYRARSGAIGFIPDGLLYGAAPSLALVAADRTRQEFLYAAASIVIGSAEVLFALLLLILYVNISARSEYLWFIAFLLIDGVGSLYFEWKFLRFDAPPLLDAMMVLAAFLRYIPLAGFLATFTRALKRRTVYALQLAIFLFACWNLPFLLAHIRDADPFAAFLAHHRMLYLQVPFALVSVLYLVWDWDRGNEESGLLILPFLVANSIALLGFAFPAAAVRLELGGLHLNFDELSTFFFMLSIGPVLFLRQRRETRDHARATAELNAAREIQQQLVPSALPSIAGYDLRAVYYPAAEVGGDLYQVLPRADGSTWIVVGDVSGKGVRAAMTGALAIGAVRTLASEMDSPGVLLGHLNAALHSAESEGFVTCLALLVTASGACKVASAAHLAPYLNGAEIVLDPGLPLGTVAEMSYADHSIQLNLGDRLTLLTDGVPEAQSASRELFGFDRTAALSNESAEVLAGVARQFGQTDDITVLTLQFRPRQALDAAG